MVKVEIIKQCGENGLRLAGTIVTVNKKTAKWWVKLGCAKYVKKKKGKK